MTYLDCTWCVDKDCAKFKKCDKTYNEYHKKRNTENLPVAIYTGKLRCFEAKKQ